MQYKTKRELNDNFIFTFSKQSFDESLDFCNLSLPPVFHKFDSQLPSSLARAVRFEHQTFARSDTGVVIDSEPHLSRTCKTSLLFALLAVRVQAGCSTFPFYTPT